jgi:hypothetical protein
MLVINRSVVRINFNVMTNRLLDLLPRVSGKTLGVDPKTRTHGSNEVRTNQRISSFFSVANVVLTKVLEKERNGDDSPDRHRQLVN